MKNKCDISDCKGTKVKRCANPECDLDVCKKHMCLDGKCIYCSSIGVTFRKPKKHELRALIMIQEKEIEKLKNMLECAGVKCE